MSVPTAQHQPDPGGGHEIWLPARIAPPFGDDLWLEILRRLQAYLQGSGIAPWVTPGGVWLRGLRRPIGAFDLSLILRWLMDQRELGGLGVDDDEEGPHED
jgi:hypothetical protein